MCNHFFRVLQDGIRFYFYHCSKYSCNVRITLGWQERWGCLGERRGKQSRMELFQERGPVPGSKSDLV